MPMDTSAIVLVAAGLGAGALTTLAGMGGGVLLVIALSGVVGPAGALAITTPALLASNAHRAWVFRSALATSDVARIAATVVPAGAAGAALASRLPEKALHIGLFVVIVIALGQRVVRGMRARLSRPAGGRRTPPAGPLAPPSVPAVAPGRVPAWLLGVAAAAAVLSGMSGGGGVLVGPGLVGGGLSGRSLIAAGSTIAVATHLGRSIGYGGFGMLGRAHLGAAAALGAGLLVGNLVGVRLRKRCSEVTTDRLTWAVTCGALGWAAIGLR